MNDKLQSVMQKIVKLRALAAQAGTPAEAETAAAQAEALLVKYQIDEASIETPTNEEPLDEHDALWSGKTNEHWRGILCAGLTKDHGCAAIACRDGKTTTYRIAGRKSDVEIVHYMFTWLTTEIDRLSGSEKGRADKTSFRIGAATGVLRAMRAARAVEVQAAPTGASASLVLTNRHDDAMNKLKSMMSGRFSSAKTRRVVSDAFSRGVAAGGNLAPRNALGGSGSKMLGGGR